MFKLTPSKIVFAPEGVATAVATPVAESGEKEMDRLVHALIVPKEPAATRKPQEPGPSADPEPTAKGAGEGNDAEDEGTAGDDGEPSGSGAQPGGQADDEDFDAFGSAAGSEGTQGSDDEDDPDAEKYTVKVDGQEEQVTLTDLMKAYSGSKAIERRLQEATEAKTAVETERATLTSAKAALDAETLANREKFAHGLTMLKALVARPAVKQPDPALKASDPSRYTLAMLEYQQDQERVRNTEAQVDEMLNGYEAKRQTDAKAYREAEGLKLVQAMPVLTDPVKGPVVAKRIHSAAIKAGFTPQEVSQASDHRMFMLAAMAGEYLRMVEKRTQANPQPAQTTNVSAKGATQPTPQSRQRTLMANKVNKAHATGAVSDVAAMLIVPKPKSGRR